MKKVLNTLLCVMFFPIGVILSIIILFAFFVVTAVKMTKELFGIK